MNTASGPTEDRMKKTAFALTLCFLLSACSTTTTTKVTTYNEAGEPVVSESTSTTTNDTVESMKKIGGNVKDGVVSGYEWTKDKTVKGYEWVKGKVTNDGSAAK